jgi:hypothetical protein
MPTSPYRAIIDEARAQIAAGREPDARALAARIRAVGAGAGEQEERALQQLERVLAVHRARTLVAREPSPPAEKAASPARRTPLRTKPTITANMEVRRQQKTEPFVLVWDAAPAVAEWEVRFSERSDPRADYVARETLSLPPGATAVDVPLTERPLRVHLLGRRRDGKLLRRAVISGLTAENWNDRWQRRPSAA